MGSDRRLELHAVLSALISPGKAHFQPPPTTVLQYPCIVYEFSGMDRKFADDRPYGNRRKYTVIAIDRTPDSTLPEKLAALPLCKMDRPYVTNNLYHFAFTLYY